jgi:hypothetical protein
MKEECIAGSLGIETRYPFIDRKVVQEYLNLSPDLKNQSGVGTHDEGIHCSDKIAAPKSACTDDIDNYQTGYQSTRRLQRSAYIADKGPFFRQIKSSSAALQFVCVLMIFLRHWAVGPDRSLARLEPARHGLA